MLFLKLSAFYFFYFALLGLIAPYMGLYLSSRGFDLLEIAELTSLFLLTKIIAPNVWGALADHYRRRMFLVRFGTLATLCGYLYFFAADGFWEFAFAIILFSFFWNAVLPQFEVITLHNLAEHRDRYSRVRLWGSLGFITSVSGAGYLIDIWGIAVFPWLMMAVLLALALCGAADLDEPAANAHEERSLSFVSELSRRSVVLFFLACVFLQLSHGAYYTYFSIYLESLSYQKSVIGLLWALGVLAEVVLFLVMHRWLKWHSVRTIMSIALAATALRWLLTAWFAEYWWLLVVIQLGHAMSFGAMHACAIQYVHATFSQTNQGKAQALYSSAGFGLGGALGAYTSGLVVAAAGYQVAFYVCAAFALFAFFAIRFQRTE
ncbi:MAG: MFS transporter [Oleiphilaceae bacterium]|nr:MFS transporter [Oleiphilaceae bacterium]